MNRLFYFKVTFLSVAAALFSGMLVYGLLEVDFSNRDAITRLLLKSLVVAVVTALILGLLNMYFKVGNFQEKKK